MKVSRKRRETQAFLYFKRLAMRYNRNYFNSVETKRSVEFPYELLLVLSIFFM